MDIIDKIRKANLRGLGGAGFPTADKWQMVRDSDEARRFLICNLSEGEPGVFKDEYILINHLPELIKGIEICSEIIKPQRKIIFLNDKYQKYVEKIKRAIGDKKIEIFIDTGRYLCGEETTLLNTIEGKLRQPESKPPFPTESGLFGYPTLINNAETFYRVCQIAEDKYEGKRFYCLSGDITTPKVVENLVEATIEEVIGNKKLLDKIGFVQYGGLSGEILPADEFNKNTFNTGAIIIYDKKRKPIEALIASLTFFKDESCGKCTPCREGVYRSCQLINSLIDGENLWDRKEILDTMEEIAESLEFSSFCPLGRSVANPIKSAIKYFRSELING